MENETRIPAPSNPISPRRSVQLYPTSISEDFPLSKNVVNSLLLDQGDQIISLASPGTEPNDRVAASPMCPTDVSPKDTLSSEQLAIAIKGTSPSKTKSVTFVSPIHKILNIDDSEYNATSSSQTLPSPEESQNPLSIDLISAKEHKDACTHATSLQSSKLEIVPCSESINSNSDVSLISVRSFAPGVESNLMCNSTIEKATIESIHGNSLTPCAQSSSNEFQSIEIGDNLEPTTNIKLSQLMQNETILSQLKKATSELFLLKSKNRENDIKYQGTIKMLEMTIKGQQESISSMQIKHADELARVKEKMTSELESERHRLLSQIRHQTKLSEVSSKEPTLDDSIEQPKIVPIADTSPMNIRAEHDHEDTESLKIELIALKDLQLETEKAYDILIHTTNDQEQAIKVLQAENDSLKSQLYNSPDIEAEVSTLRMRLENAQDRIAELEQEISAVVAIEDQMIAKNAEIKLEYDRLVSNLKKQLKIYKTLFDPASPQIYLDLAGKWAVDGTNSAKFPQEIEKEGHGSTQDETHLWCINKEELDQNLIEKECMLQRGLTEKQVLLEEHEHERLEMERRIEDVRKESVYMEKTAQANLESIRRKLSDLFLEQQVPINTKQESLHCKRINQSNKQQMFTTSKVKDPCTPVISKTVQMADLELQADASTSKQYHQACLATEKQQNNILKAKFDSLNQQLIAKKRELAETGSPSNKKSPQQLPQKSPVSSNIVAMQAKIGEMQGEIKLQKEQLSYMTTQRDSLLEKVDSLSLTIVNLEAILSKQKTNSDMIETKSLRISDELNSKSSELEQLSQRKEELQLEVSSVKNNLRTAHENVAVLETNLASLQRKYDDCCKELADSKAASTKMESDFLSISADATHNQQTIDILQSSLKTSEDELESTHLSLENKKHTSQELQGPVGRLSGNLDGTNKKVEGLGKENSLLKREVTQKKQDLQHLHQEACSLRLELKDSQERTITLESEKSRLLEELKTHTRELTKSKEVISGLRQKLNDSNKEVSSLKQSTEHLKIQIKGSGAEKMRWMKIRDSLESDILELKAKLSSRANLLLKKEEQLQVVTQDKQALTSKISDLKRKVQALTTGKSKLKGSELQVEKQKLEQCQRVLLEKNDELKKMRSEIESLQCSLECESEKYYTLELELSSTKVELQDSQEQQSKLATEMEQMKQNHKAEIESSEKALQQLENQLLLSRTKCYELDSEISALSVKTDRLVSEAESDKKELKSQLSELKSRLLVSEKENNTLRSDITEQRKEYQATKASYSKQIKENQSHVDQLQTDLETAQTQIKHLNTELAEFHQQLDEETKKRAQLQCELSSQLSENNAVTAQFHDIEQLLNAERTRTENLTEELMNSELKAQELSKNLHETQQQLYSAEESIEETQASYAQTLEAVKTAHEQKKLTLQLENEQLSKGIIFTKKNLAATEHQLHACEEQMSTSHNKLTSMEQKCLKLESLLNSKSRGHKELKSDHTELQSTHAEARKEIADLSEKLLVQSTIAEQLMVETQTKKSECDSLQEQLILQQETAAASLNRMQQNHQEKCADLYSKIQNQADKLMKAQGSIRTLQHEVIALKANRTELENLLREDKQQYIRLETNLNQETASLRVYEQKVEQLERLIEVEESLKMKVESQLKQEMMQREQAELTVENQKHELLSTTQDFASVNSALINTKEEYKKLKGECMLAQAEVTSLKQKLTMVNNAAHNFKEKSESELQFLRERYQTEKKALKEKVRELQRNIKVLSGQHEYKGEEIAQLQAANQSLSKEQQELAKQLTNCKYELRAKKDDCKNLQTKVTSLEAQLKQLDQEMSLLSETQVQYEQYRKKLDKQTKDEAHRIRTEVTEQMEQQYSAHKYLENLRSENERIKLKEKEREISQLRSELAHKKQENKQGKIRVQHLEVESQHLRAQQKDQERSRRRLEARLEQVNDTLSRTLPLSHLSGSTRPLHSSTPRALFVSSGRSAK